MKTCIYLFLLFFHICFITIEQSYAEYNEKWVVYYSDKEDIKTFLHYDTIVFDSDNHISIDSVLDGKNTVLGYISLGEVESERSYFEDVKEDGILLEENPNWKGSFYVDVRSEKWISRVIEKLVPDILHTGFNGLFLDTLDNPAHLERIDSKKYAGMTQAAINLIRTIRLHYPDIKIMMNRGYELLPEVGAIIDMELGESVYADYDFIKKEYNLVSKDLYETQVDILKKAKRKNPELKIYTLDYWNSDDKKGISDIYKLQRKNGFIPYVSTINLDTVIDEPF